MRGNPSLCISGSPRWLTPPRDDVFFLYLSLLERMVGIEPTQPAWKAGTLPLSYTRLKSLLTFKASTINLSSRQ